MNLSAARDEMDGRGANYLTATRKNIMLNAAKNALEDEFAFPWLETTTTGTAPLTIADLKYVLYVQDTTNDNELVGLDARDIALGGSDFAQTGTPQSWWLDGVATLSVWPTSTSVQLSVRYVKHSPELSADADTPLIPVAYHSLWLDYAMVEALKDRDNYAGANALLSYARTFRLPQLIEVYASRNRQNSGFMQIRVGSFDD